MYNMIEQREPLGFNTVENYLYFDNSEEEIMKEEVGSISQVLDNLDLEEVNHVEFTRLLSKYQLTAAERHGYQAKFQKAKRIYKRDKAKTRASASCLKLLQPLSVETSESVGVKQEAEMGGCKEQEQKRRKRISAQMSRDKKKIYIQQIETQNQALKRKCRELEAENNQLKSLPKPPIEKKRGSLKSWFIMSLILFSLQKQNEVGGIQPFHNKEFINSSYLLKNAQQIIEQYDKLPVASRLMDIQKIAHFTDLSQQEEAISKLKMMEYFPSGTIKEAKTWEQEDWNSDLARQQSLQHML